MTHLSSPERNICHTCFGITKNRFIFATSNKKFLPKVHFKLFENLRDDYFLLNGNKNYHLSFRAIVVTKRAV